LEELTAEEVVEIEAMSDEEFEALIREATAEVLDDAM
jgi:hypothetical protein